jgi:hypothetical protein
MKKKSLISSVVVGVFLLSGIAVVALAGTEPSPFKPNINQLGAVENVLNSVKNRVEKVLSKPPDYGVSRPSLKGAAKRLEAIVEQLLSVDDKIFSIVEEVMGVDPSPLHPRSEVVPALENVRDSAQSIVDSIDALPVFSDFTIDCDSITDKIECKEEPSCDWVFNGDPIDPGHCENAT